MKLSRKRLIKAYLQAYNINILTEYTYLALFGTTWQGSS